MHMQSAEVPAESLVAVEIKGLVPKEQHLMLHEGRPELRRLMVGQRLGEVDARDFSSDARRRRRHSDRVVGHSGLLKAHRATTIPTRDTSS
jgi:hypothetical protein